MNLHDLKEQSALVVSDIKAVAVITPDDYVAAGSELVRHVAARKAIIAKFAEPKKLAHEAHRAISKLENEFLDIVDKSERLIRGAMSDFKAAEARAIAEERAALEAVARAQEEERQIQTALSLDAAGRHDEAEQVLAAEVAFPAVIIEETTAPGVSIRETWDFEITDPSKIDRKFLVSDIPKIRSVVKSVGPDAEHIVGGIRVRKVFTTAVRT